MAVGDILRLKATALGEDGQSLEGRDIVWSTSSNSRSRVTRDGTLEGIQVGEDTVYASLDGRWAKALLRIFSPKVAAVIVTLSSSAIETGQTAQASAILYNKKGAEVEGNIYWTSSNPAVATISEDGRISARAAGKTTIRAISEGKTDSETLTVLDGAALDAVASVSVTAPASQMYIGKRLQLAAEVRNARGEVMNNVALSWRSKTPSVASVSSGGEVEGLAQGTGTFEATVSERSGSTSLSVMRAPVNAVSIVLQPASVPVGGSSEGVATVYDPEGEVLTGRTVQYSSSNPQVAFVSPAGMVTGVTQGTSSITASSEGKSASATMAVTVPAPKPVASVSVALTSPALVAGSTTQALATPRDDSGQPLSGRTVSWSSSNTAVATVNGSGVVTARSGGSASIRATIEGPTGSAALNVSAAVVLSRVEINPASTTVNVGESRAFTAIGRNSNGSTSPVTVAWSATGGSITQQGSYTAGQIAGQFLVIAACSCGFADTSTIDVLAPAPPAPPAPTLDAVTVSPNSRNLEAGQAYTFIAEGWMSGSSSSISTPVVWTATGGSVDQSGRYVAGSSAGTFVVRAQSTENSSKRDSAIVTITVPVPPPAPSSDPIAALTVSPSTKTLQAGEAFRFVANGWLQGSPLPVSTPVTWSATGGAVDQSGNYTAGSVAGTFVVRARSTLITWRVDSAIVTIVGGSSGGGSTPPPPPAPTVQSFTMSPSSISLLALGTQQFSASAVWSDGVSRPVNVTYSATGGSVTSGGLFAAGLLAGEFRVIAACDCGKADTSSVSISLLPVPTDPPATGIWKELKFDQYSSTDALRMDSQTFRWGEDDERNRITLESSIAPPAGAGFTKAMRYNFPANAGTDYAIHRSWNLPAVTNEIWVEFWLYHAGSFTTEGPMSGGVDYKTFGIHSLPDGSGGDVRVKFGKAGEVTVTYPNQGSDFGSGEMVKSEQDYPGQGRYFDNSWTGVRVHFKLGQGNGMVELHVNRGQTGWRQVIDRRNLNSGAATGMDFVGLGMNMNKGTAREMFLMWGALRTWNSNPGW
jgi:uncharacterized protein YjdB